MTAQSSDHQWRCHFTFWRLLAFSSHIVFHFHYFYYSIYIIYSLIFALIYEVSLSFQVSKMCPDHSESSQHVFPYVSVVEPGSCLTGFADLLSSGAGYNPAVLITSLSGSDCRNFGLIQSSLVVHLSQLLLLVDRCSLLSSFCCLACLDSVLLLQTRQFIVFLIAVR